MTGRLEDRLKARAAELGFALCGVAPAAEADGFGRYLDWLDEGFAGEMAYLRKNAAARRHPESILAEVKSVVMLGAFYAADDDAAAGGRVARYARGPDYHNVLWGKLDGLLDWLRREVPECAGRGVVDTAPLLERDFARRAGLGWFGKNTMLIHKQSGSYMFLAALLVDISLQPDDPHGASHCGSCTACLDACPTDAFAGPGVLDARRCISYLTIEHRGPIDEGLRPLVGDWLFGCDVCQEVCPWNRKAPAEVALPRRGDLARLDPAAVLSLDEAAFREAFRGTALKRPKRSGLRRNAAVVLGNVGSAGAIPVLERAADDPDPVVADAARWALDRVRRRLLSIQQDTDGGSKHGDGRTGSDRLL